MKKCKKYYTNPDIFIDLSQDKPILIFYNKFDDLGNNLAIPINFEEIKRLNEIELQLDSALSFLDQKFIELDLISSTPYKKNKWFWNNVSRLFHEGTKDIFLKIPKDYPLLDYSEIGKITSETLFDLKKLPKNVSKSSFISLPKPQLDKLTEPFWKVLFRRKTSRSFFSKPISLQKLSTLLYTTFAIQEQEEGFYKRYALSAGGLHPVRGYVIIMRVEGLKKGIYYYDSFNHILILIKNIDAIPLISSILCNQDWSEAISVGVFLTHKVNILARYNLTSRAYRQVLFDIGHVSQTFLLTATALNLNYWITGALSESKVEKLINLDINEEQPFFFCAVGLGDNNGFAPENFKVRVAFDKKYKNSLKNVKNPETIKIEKKLLQ